MSTKDLSRNRHGIREYPLNSGQTDRQATGCKLLLHGWSRVAARNRPLLPAIGIRAAFLVAVACGLMLASGCGNPDDAGTTPKKKYEVADENNTAPVPADSQKGTSGNASKSPAQTAPSQPETIPPAQPPSIPSTDLESMDVPKGSTPELLAFIDRMQQQFDQYRQNRPAPGTEQVVLKKMRTILESELGAANKALESNPDEAARKKAIDAKEHALSYLIQVAPGEPWLERVKTFAQTLATDKNPDIVLKGRTILLGLRIGDLSNNRSKDIKGLVNEMKILLANPKRDRGVLDVTQQAVMLLQMQGYHDQASEALKLIADAFKDHSDPKLAAEAVNIYKQLALLDLDIDGKLDAVARNEPGAVEPFKKAIKAALAQDNPGEVILAKLLRSVAMLEQTGQYVLAISVCQSIQQAYANSSSAQLRAGANQAVDLALRRLQLVGKPFVVEGTTVDGAPFDFSKYKGKVVLVDFWATWCGPCIAELPNIRKNYEQYQSKGFDVVGVNLDQNRDDVTRFLKSEKLPWATIVNKDLADRCGVESIPFVVLLDQKGIVVALHVRGSTLGEKLKELLGPPAAAANAPVAPSKKDVPKQSRVMRHGQPTAKASMAVFASFENLDETEPASNGAVKDAKKGSVPADDEDLQLPDDDPSQNPYTAPAGLSPGELIDFLFDMAEKPKSIRRRPGFAEAVVDAAGRILATDTKDQYQVIAALAKFRTLHEKACFGDEAADQQLWSFVQKMQGDKRPAISKRIAFFRIERRAIDVDELPLDQVPVLLSDLKKYIASQKKMDSKYLRLASVTVHAINRLEDLKQREKYFTEFGTLFAGSADRQLSHYGKKLMGGKERASEWVGKPLELEGMTAMGTAFNWADYRGKVVIVDFWATWCGPCQREMPHLKSLFEKYRDAGFDVVAVNLDSDAEALAKYLEEQKIPWTNIVGESAQQLATRYGVKGIPTMMLVDAKGTVIAVSHKVSELEGRIPKLLKPQ